MIAIIGAGISGLSLGHFLKKNGFDDFQIFEKSDQVGGKIQSINTSDYHLEMGPNTLMTSPLLLEFIDDLGLNDQIIYPNEEVVKNRFLGLNDKVKKLPSKPQQLLFNNIISLSAKFKLMKELKLKPFPVPSKQTVTDFFTIHFGNEIVEKLVKSFCRGIYGANADDLLIETCFPQLVKYQEEYGSLIKALKSQKSLEKRKVVTLKGGLKTLNKRLYEELKQHINLNSDITSLAKNNNTFELLINKESSFFNQVIFCCNAKSIAKLCKDIMPHTSKALQKINYTGLKVTHSIYNKAKSLFPYKGFGILLPPSQSNTLFGHIWNSSMIPSFAEDKTIITTMSSLEPNNTIQDKIDTYFSKHFNLKKEDLLSQETIEWKHGIPRYDVNHFDFLKIYEKENKINLYICSNLVNGVSIPDRLTQTNTLANKLIE